jgi:hypothetical protein
MDQEALFRTPAFLTNKPKARLAIPPYPSMKNVEFFQANMLGSELKRMTSMNITFFYPNAWGSSFI